MPRILGRFFARWQDKLSGCLVSQPPKYLARLLIFPTTCCVLHVSLICMWEGEGHVKGDCRTSLHKGERPTLFR